MLQSFRLPVTFLAVLTAGLLGGLLWGTAMEQQKLSVLDAVNWTLARHSIDSLFARLMPWSWNITLILLFAAAYMNSGSARWLFLLAALFLLAGIVVTLIFDVPINKQLAMWTPNSIPSNWMELRSRWLVFHHTRTVLGMLAFISALSGFAKR